MPNDFVKQWLYKQSIKACYSIFFVSESLQKKYHERMSIKPKREMAIPLAIDHAMYNDQYSKSDIRKRLGYGNKTCIIGYIGRFADFKRVDKLIKAVSLLRPRIVTIRLLIIGFGEALPMLK